MTTCRPSNFSKKNTMSNWQRMRGLVSWELREPWKHEGAAHVSFGSIPLKKAAVIRCIGVSADGCRPLCGLQCGHWDQLGHLAKVLGGGGENELVTRAVWAS